jgi:hypothetical protein
MTKARLAPFRQTFFVGGAISALLSLGPAWAGSLQIFSTGVDDAGQSLAAPGSTDSHWSIGGVQAITAIDPNSGWIANITTGPKQSGWIGPNPVDQTEKTYNYIQSFFVPAGAKGLSLSGKWATDDGARLYLNGQEILSARTESFLFPSPWTVFQSFATDDTALFLPGATNELRAEIINTGGPTGFQAQISGTYQDVPAPLPLLGLAAAFHCRRRLRRRQMESRSSTS